MPENPDKHRELTRLVRRERIRSAAFAFVIAGPVVALLVVFVLPDREVSPPELATATSTALAASDDVARILVNFRLADGAQGIIRVRPTAAPEPGDTFLPSARGPIFPVARLSSSRTLTPARPPDLT